MGATLLPPLAHAEENTPDDSAGVPAIPVVIKAEEPKPDVESEPSDGAVSEPEQGWVKEKVEPQTRKIERFVMPITNWVEEKLHDSTIANPALKKKRQQTEPIPGISLREAIELARKQHPGTILSADKIKSNESLTYRIKILSQGGVVRVLTIDGQPAPSSQQEQP